MEQQKGLDFILSELKNINKQLSQALAENQADTIIYKLEQEWGLDEKRSLLDR